MSPPSVCMACVEEEASLASVQTEGMYSSPWVCGGAEALPVPIDPVLSVVYLD